MEKIALITDSASDLSKDIIEKYNIRVLPFRIIYEKMEYLDNVTITAEEVYKTLDTEIPTSSLPSLADMENLFEKLKEEGYTHAIAITLSSGLSGIFNALKLVSNNHEDIVSHIYDSKSISLGEGALVEECAKLIEQGKSYEYIVNEIPNIRKRIHVYFVVGTLKYLKRGGRIGKVAGTIGEILNLKPIIGIDDEGMYYTYDKVRGRKQSIKKLVDMISKFTSKGKIYLMHGNALEETKSLYDTINDLPGIASVYLGDNISPVSGVHSGPGLIGVVFLEEELS